MNLWEAGSGCQNCSVRSSALFSGLTEQGVGQINQFVEQVTMKPGEVLYKLGDETHHLFTVRSGLIKLIQYLPDGTQRIVRLIHGADAFGLEALVAKNYEHEAVALRTTKICRYPKESISDLSKTNPMLYDEVMLRWQKTLTDADIWLTRLSTGTSKKRMANLLLLLHEKGSTQCHLFSREDIGSMLSITVETASRTISEFKRLSLMSEIRPNFFNLDIEGLNKIIKN